MSKRRIHLPLGLATRDQWDRWDCALAFAVLMPRLLAPATSQRRANIRTLFYSSLLERLRDVGDVRAEEIRLFLDNYCAAQRRFALHHTSGLASYRERLYLGEVTGRYIRSILTVGLTVKIMASPNGVKQSKRVLDTAQQFLIANYRTSPELYSNTLRTRQAWFKWKRVGHLCAALVDYLPSESSNPRIDDETLISLEADMAAFAITAASYQSFLTGQTIYDDAEIPARSLNSFKLARLPKLRLLGPNLTKTALPRWGRRFAAAESA